MRDIGGFLELENNHGHEFHENGIALNSGRNCLRFLLRARESEKFGFLNYCVLQYQILVKKKM